MMTWRFVSCNENIDCGFFGLSQSYVCVHSSHSVNDTEIDWVISGKRLGTNEQLQLIERVDSELSGNYFQGAPET